jgi:hypothetical protein
MVVGAAGSVGAERSDVGLGDARAEPIFPLPIF